MDATEATFETIAGYEELCNEFDAAQAWERIREREERRAQ